jgi:hypothetical protein
VPKAVPATERESEQPATFRKRKFVVKPIGWDLLACTCFVLFAFWLTSGLWPDPDTKFLTHNPGDQILHEWFLAYETGLWSGDFNLVTDRMNAPEGVNLLTNTPILALGLLLAPITATLGGPTAFAVVIALNLAATAIAWYLLFTRGLGASRPAAAVGAAFAGFAPGMISQSNSHPGLTAHFLIPPMLWSVTMLAQAARRRPVPIKKLVGAGVLFGLLSAAQIFLGEEVMFLTALTLTVLTLAYVTMTGPSGREILAFGAGLGIAVGVAACLLAYPLWLQFAGPQSLAGGLYSPQFFSADLASFTAFSPLSIAGSESSAALSVNAAEYNTFLGWPLVLLTLGLAIWLRRDPLSHACIFAMGLMYAFSLGPEIVINRDRTAVIGPFQLLSFLPWIDLALPMRFALAGIPLTATLLVLGLEKSSALRKPIVPVAVALALLPLIPNRLPTSERPAVPGFYADGSWRQCASRGGEVIVPVPLPSPYYPEPIRYATEAFAQFAIPQGYFIGPYGANGAGALGAPARRTSALLDAVAQTGTVPAIDDTIRAEARKDVSFWKANCLVLTAHPRFDQLRDTLNLLYGPGTRVADAIVWRVDDDWSLAN